MNGHPRRLLLLHVVGEESGASAANASASRQIPGSYLRLQEAAAAERRRRGAEGEVQFLTEAQLERLVELDDAGGDIARYDDLPAGKIAFGHAASYRARVATNVLRPPAQPSAS